MPNDLAQPSSQVRSGSTAGDLFGLGAVLAASHLTVALEVGVSLSHHGAMVRSLVLLLVPIAATGIGLGAALHHGPLRQTPIRHARLIGGLALLAFIPITLRVNFLTNTAPALWLAAALHVAVLATWYVSAGIRLARGLGSDDRIGTMGWRWGAHQAGWVCGYVGVSVLLPLAGANVLHLAIAVGVLASGRWRTLWLPGQDASHLIVWHLTQGEWKHHPDAQNGVHPIDEEATPREAGGKHSRGVSRANEEDGHRATVAAAV